MSARNDPTIRHGSLLISTLVLTPDGGLDAYRAQRVADPRATTEQLRRARAALDGIAFAIASNDQANWLRVEQAWAILRRNEATSSEPAALDPDALAPNALEAEESESEPGEAETLRPPSSQPQDPAARGLRQVDQVPAHWGLGDWPSAPLQPRAPDMPLPPPPVLPSGIGAPVKPAMTPSPWTPMPEPSIDIDSTQCLDSRMVRADVTPFEGVAMRPQSAVNYLGDHDAMGRTACGATHAGDGVPFSRGGRGTR